MITNPFSPEILADLFETSPNHPDVIKKRESTIFELKENFQPQSFPDYGRTLAAFANRSGGYLLFGFKDKPHVLLGMANSRFREMDPNTLTQFLNNYFSPSIHLEHFVHNLHGKDFGLIYVHPGTSKPVVCSRTTNPLRDGDIYYRYQGETRLIAAADLHVLIEERLESERKSWRSLLQRAAHISPSATYLLDVNQGNAQGEHRTFVIDHNLLDKVKFIHEGRFDQTGEPTLRVLGNVEVVRTEAIPGRGRDVPVDPTKVCTLYQKDVVAKLQEIVGETIPFGPDPEKSLTGVYLRAVIIAYSIQTPSSYYYRPLVAGSRPFYSEALIDWIVEQYKEDSQFFRKAYETAYPKATEQPNQSEQK